MSLEKVGALKPMGSIKNELIHLGKCLANIFRANCLRKFTWRKVREILALDIVRRHQSPTLFQQISILSRLALILGLWCQRALSTNRKNEISYLENWLPEGRNREPLSLTQNRNIQPGESKDNFEIAISLCEFWGSSTNRFLAKKSGKPSKLDHFAMNYLNDGVGNPWAWHNKVTPCIKCFSIVVLLTSEERVGARELIGSIKKQASIYLNFGVGNPWPWQSNATSSLIRHSNHKVFAFDNNFGALVPTGSIRD